MLQTHFPLLLSYSCKLGYSLILLLLNRESSYTHKELTVNEQVSFHQGTCLADKLFHPRSSRYIDGASGHSKVMYWYSNRCLRNFAFLSNRCFVCTPAINIFEVVYFLYSDIFPSRYVCQLVMFVRLLNNRDKRHIHVFVGWIWLLILLTVT